MDELKSLEVYEFGQSAGQGNLVGIQPFMRTSDYASEADFFNRLDSYFHQAAQKGWLQENSVVILPEYIGTWLVAAGESPRVLSAPTIQLAMRELVIRHMGRFIRALWQGREKDRVTAGLFRMKAAAMALIYQSVFSRLAIKYNVTIAAGSILLPNPAIDEGEVRIQSGPLYNTAFLFHPNGQPDRQLVRKIYPIESEQPFVAPTQLNDLPVFETPAGRLGILVCADSWFPATYNRLKGLGADLVVVPSAASPGSAWDQPWAGYSGWALPGDVDPAHIQMLTERQAWETYALTGRLASSGAAVGLNIFLYGDLWDLDMTGGQWRLVCGSESVEGTGRGAALINLWLPAKKA